MKQRERLRIVSLFWIFATFGFLLIWRLVNLQYRDHTHYRNRADAQHLGQAELPALRGEIRDRNDVVLATSVARWSLAVNPELLRNNRTEDQAVERLTESLGCDIDDIAVALSGSGTFAWVARKVDEEVARQWRERPLDGVLLLREPTPGRRYYPKGRLASTLTGITGIDDQGLDGLEASWDEHLAGEPGLLRAFMDRDGWATIEHPTAMVRPARDGNNVILTIDESIQYAAERELARQVKEYDAAGGIVLVMDATNAEILALAVNPDFPADQSGQVSPEVRRNRAVTDPYEPGSTFKIFLAAAALSSGVGRHDTFRSGGVITVDGWRIHNASDGLHSGAMESLQDILAFSFNIGTASVALHIGKDALYQQLLDFGFGETTGIDLMGESAGLLGPASEWADINTATISFGQGVACTPLQLCSAMQAVANGGVRIKPRVVRAVTDSNGEVVLRFQPEVLGRPISGEVAEQVLAILEHVCEKGTGEKARVPGFRVGGKTGTAQVSEDGGYSSHRFIASFLGVAPVDRPRIVILVKIEEPSVQWGGVVAAPVFSRVAEKALWRLGVQPEGASMSTNPPQK